MPNYKKMYHILFNEISETIERLQMIQQKAEELYINSDDTLLHIIENDIDKPKKKDP